MRADMRGSGAEAAPLSELDTRFRGPLMAYFLRLIGNRSEAEDLTQEVFIRLADSASFAKARQSQQPEQVNAYVFRVARNLLHDRARSGRRWKMQPLSSDDAAPAAEAIRDFVDDRHPERLLIGRESLEEVHSCLNEMDERSKGIFMLFRLGGMKQKDIASLYGVSISTVEKALISTSVHLSERFRGTNESVGNPVGRRA